MSEIRVRTQYAQTAGRTVFVATYGPATEPRSFGYVFCPAFGDEGECAYRTFHEMASLLASSGVSAVCPDLTGTSNSPVGSSSARFSEWLDDVNFAADLLTSEFGVTHIGFLGMRFGCMLALRSVASTWSARYVVLWDPPLSNVRHVRSFARRAIVRDALNRGADDVPKERLGAKPVDAGVVDLDGYLLDPSLFADMERQSWSALPTTRRSPLEAVVISLGLRDRSLILAEKVRRVLPEADVQTLTLTKPCPRFWNRMGIQRPTELMNLTKRWILTAVEEPQRADLSHPADRSEDQP